MKAFVELVYRGRRGNSRGCKRMRKRVSGARREGRISLRPRSRRTRMLKCQRNDESSFAVSASTCIRRKEGDSRGASEGYEGEQRARGA